MYKKSKKLLVWCLVLSMVLTQMIFTNAAFAATTTATSTRLAGADRYATAIEVSKAGWTSSDYAVLAYGEDFPDALAAAPLAKKYNAPILLTGKASLADGVLTELQRLGVKNVLIVGGEGVVSATVADALTTANIKVERLAGADRYATSLAVANKIGTTSEVVVAYGENYPDALSISAIAAAKGMPILLTDKDAMNADVKAYIGTKTAYVVGGTGVVSDAVFNALTGAVRLGGADRYATNAAVLAQFASNLDFSKIFLATGEGFADALTGSAYAAKVGASIVLTGATLADGTKTFLNGKMGNSVQVIALGGVAVVSDAAVASVTTDTTVPTTLGVESVVNVGLNAVQVVYSQEVDKDSATTVENYLIDGSPLSSSTGDRVILSSDNKTVLIMLQNARTQYNKVLFTVKKDSVYSKDTLTTVPKYENNVTFSDVDIPAVKAVTVTGNKKITVEFTEPVLVSGVKGTTAGSLFKIDGQYLTSYGFSSAAVTTTETAAQFSNKIDLTFGVALPAGSHSLTTPKGSAGYLIDGANFKVSETQTNFTVESVTTAPSIVSVTGENNGVVYVTYNRAMDKDTAASGANYRISSALSVVPTAEFKSNTGDTVVKLDFGKSVVAEGSNVLVITKDTVKDSYGNKLDTNNDVRLSFNAIKDTTKPTVVSVTLIDSTHVRVKFSEVVDQNFARNKSNYTLKDSAGITRDYISSFAAVLKDTDVYTINLGTALTGSNYTLKIKNIQDMAVNANVMDEYIANINGLDDINPNVADVVKVSTSTVAVFFDEAMDAATITNSANFAFVGGDNTTRTIPSSANFKLGEDNKYVQIEFPTGYSVVGSGASGQYEVKSIRVANVKDAAGNVLAGIVSVNPVNITSNSVARPTYVPNTFKLYSDTNKVWAELEFDQSLSQMDYTDFTVAGVIPTSGYLSGKKVVLNFDATGDRDTIKAAGAAAQLMTVASPKSKNVAGITIAPMDVVAVTVYDEQMAPILRDVAVSGTNVVLTFNENIDNSIIGNAKNDFVITASGTVLDVDSIALPTSATNTVTFVLKSSVSNGTKVIVRAVSADPANNDIYDIKDKLGNQNKYIPTSDDLAGIEVTAGGNTAVNVNVH